MVENREMILNIFRRLVYVLYLEIGALQPANHPEIARKARLNTAYFQREKTRQAAELYRQVERENSPAKILAPFEERTGLSLEDIARAFSEGDWRNKHGGVNFGGPKWARIAQAAVELRGLIEQENWEEADALVHEIMRLKNNQGYLINQLERMERRR